MRTSPAGRAAITRREGVRLEAYPDVKGIWTIGVGHTAGAGPPAPCAGMRITRDECDAILARDLLQAGDRLNRTADRIFERQRERRFTKLYPTLLCNRVLHSER